MRLLTFETFDLSDEKTRADQQKNNDEDKYKDKDNDKYKMTKRPNMCHIFENDMTQGYHQIR